MTNRTQALYAQAKTMLPGGTGLLSKRPEGFAPGRWPAYWKQARGVEVIDLDERRYLDMSMCGIGSTLLGYADPDVTAAVVKQVQAGAMCTLNPPQEVELAKLLLELHPWAQRVRFGRMGGETMAMAVRMARTATKRDRVAICGYHGWHDWYLACNLGDNSALDGHLLPGLSPAGVPRSLRGSVLSFKYNQLAQLEQIVKEHGDQLAAVVMEPTRSADPALGFFEGVRALCDDCGALLVIDEITAGWRLHMPGAHMKYDVTPDMAVYAKTLGNGHPMAAIVGSAAALDPSQDSFISSTYWTEAVGPTAALACIAKMQRIDVPAHVRDIGQLLQDGWQMLGKKHDLPTTATGHPALTHTGFEHPKALTLQTLFTIRMLDCHILAGAAFYPTLAHNQGHVQQYLDAADNVFAELAEAIRDDDIEKRIDGPLRTVGFARLT